MLDTPACFETQAPDVRTLQVAINSVSPLFAFNIGSSRWVLCSGQGPLRLDHIPHLDIQTGGGDPTPMPSAAPQVMGARVHGVVDGAKRMSRPQSASGTPTDGWSRRAQWMLGPRMGGASGRSENAGAPAARGGMVGGVLESRVGSRVPTCGARWSPPQLGALELGGNRARQPFQEEPLGFWGLNLLKWSRGALLSSKMGPFPCRGAPDALSERALSSVSRCVVETPLQRLGRAVACRAFGALSGVACSKLVGQMDSQDEITGEPWVPPQDNGGREYGIVAD